VTSWLADVQQWITSANARTSSTFARLSQAQQRVTAELERAALQLGSKAARDVPTADPEFHKRVIDAVRAERFDRLSVKEQRYAARQFAHLTSGEMQPLLSHCPADRLANRSSYTTVLCVSPDSIRVLHSVLRAQELVASDGPARLARALRASSIEEARATLGENGFDSSWGFTANVVAHWLYAHHEASDAFTLAWSSLQQDPVLEAMLLPPVAGKSTSWFSGENRPARVRPSLEANAVTTAALIRAAYKTGAYDAHWSAFTEGLLRSVFGDPRMPPDSEGWQRLKERDTPAYERFLEQLITEDLTVFFEHAMKKEQRRKRFWLSYLKSVRRTVCILDRSTHSDVTKHRAGADAKLSAAISRARKFTTRSEGAQAFCLYFDSFVVVEYSLKGNAAYVYDRGVFEREYERLIYSDACAHPNELKNQSLATRRIRHMGELWEHGAFHALAELGIRPDPR